MRTKDAEWLRSNTIPHDGELCLDLQDVKDKLNEIEQEFIALQKENDALKTSTSLFYQ